MLAPVNFTARIDFLISGAWKEQNCGERVATLGEDAVDAAGSGGWDGPGLADGPLGVLFLCLF